MPLIKKVNGIFTAVYQSILFCPSGNGSKYWLADQEFSHRGLLHLHGTRYWPPLCGHVASLQEELKVTSNLLLVLRKHLYDENLVGEIG